MSLTMVLCAAVFGGSASAFLPRVAHRLAVPSGTSPRSACAGCGTPYPRGANGWVRAGPSCDRPGSSCNGLGSSCEQAGSCCGRPGSSGEQAGSCRGRSGEQAGSCCGRSGSSGEQAGSCRGRSGSFLGGLGLWCTIAAGATASGLLGATVGATPLLPVLLPAVVLGVLLAVIDLNCLRLPDPLVAALTLLIVAPLATLGGPGPITRGALAAGLSFLAYAMIAIWPRGGLGFGDVKLAAVLGFVLGFLGWPTLLLGVLLPHLINGPIALFLLVKGRVGRRSALPLGPALLTGALLAITLTATTRP